ncbi:hypothetical protein [Clostridium botulinum]|uniref:hypothetical protein n=1 Tax=Clostridium botulinum TaxID=1491 RepID=UPI00196794C4|nr:hypothetical protein [Clostridium botulinum]MBN1058519.1 hypothetical protein [Clostridium botulinum]
MTTYQETVLNARKKFLKLNKTQEKELLNLYKELANQLSHDISTCRTSSQDVYLRKLNEIVQVNINQLNSQLSAMVKDNIETSSQIASTVESFYYHQITDDSVLSTMFNNSVLNTSRKTVSKLIQGGYYKDGKTLDQRLWNITKNSAKDIDSLIKVNLLKGANAKELAQQVNKYVNPLKKLELKNDEVGFSKNVSYQASRLARTSITHSFRETQIQQAMNNPFNIGMKWELSPSHGIRMHGKTDVCDDYAGQDSYGLGIGVFPIDKTPIGHPQCLCITYEVNTDIKSAMKELKEWSNGGSNSKLDKWYENANTDLVTNEDATKIKSNNINKNTTKSKVINTKNEQYKTLNAKKDSLKLEYLSIDEKQKVAEIDALTLFTDDSWKKANELAEQLKIKQSEIDLITKQIELMQAEKAREVETYLIKNNICNTAKLSEKMSFETLDEIKDTLDNLVNDRGFPGLKELKYSPGICNMQGSIATYEWNSQTMYLSNKINDAKQYIKDRLKSECEWTKFREKKDLNNIAKKTMQEAIEDRKSAKDNAHRFFAKQKYQEALITHNTTRKAVIENVSDVIKHEYGHHIHNVLSNIERDYSKKFQLYGRDILKSNEYSWNIKNLEGKLLASEISMYATDSPSECFAESFCAYLKDKKIPIELENLIVDAIKKLGGRI